MADYTEDYERLVHAFANLINPIIDALVIVLNAVKNKEVIEKIKKRIMEEIEIAMHNSG